MCVNLDDVRVHPVLLGMPDLHQFGNLSWLQPLKVKAKKYELNEDFLLLIGRLNIYQLFDQRFKLISVLL
jgi:hypothetical protein